MNPEDEGNDRLSTLVDEGVEGNDRRASLVDERERQNRAVIRAISLRAGERRLRGL
jgi:hypothetical protein